VKHVSDSDEHLLNILKGVSKDQESTPGVKTLLQTISEYVNHLSNPDNIASDFVMTDQLERNFKIYSDPYGFYEMTVQKFERNRNSLLPTQQKKIANQIEDITKSGLLNEALRPHNKSERDVLENYLRNIGLLLNVPSKVKDLSDVEELILTRMDKLLRLYPDEVKHPVKDVVGLHIDASQKDALNTDVVKNVLYLWGEPGTGKSFLAEGLAEALDLSLLKLDLKSGKFEELFGNNFFDLMTSKQASLGRFTKTFLNLGGKTPVKNSVVVVDEIDKVLNNPRGEDAENIKTMFLDILSPGEKEFKLRDLGVNIDMTRYFFILVGNQRIDSEALNDRMISIEFKGFNLEAKEEIADIFFRKKLKEANLEETDENRAIVSALMDYSHTEKKQVSLRIPFKVIELYVKWLKKPTGTFDFKLKLDSFSRNKV
jgi:ATP-dependent Lon protease